MSQTNNSNGTSNGNTNPDVEEDDAPISVPAQTSSQSTPQRDGGLNTNIVRNLKSHAMSTPKKVNPKKSSTPQKTPSPSSQQNATSSQTQKGTTQNIKQRNKSNNAQLDEEALAIELERLRRQVEEQEKISQEELKRQKVDEIPKEKRRVKIQYANTEFEIDPDNDMVFSVLCLTCYRYSKEQNLNQASRFFSLLKRYGCICREKTRFEINLTDIIKMNAESVGIKTKEFESVYLHSILTKTIPHIISMEGDEEDDD